MTDNENNESARNEDFMSDEETFFEAGNDEETTASNPPVSKEVTADAITGRKTTKQYPIVVFPEDKTFLQDLKEEFGLRNDMEAFKVLLTVATDHRFDGDSDRFEAVAKEIEASRTGRKRESQIEALKRKLAELEQVKAPEAEAEA